jgi:hypothetical protein
VYLAPDRDRWRIDVRDQDGNLLRAITRPVAPHRRTPAEKEAAKNNYVFTSEGELTVSFRLADTDAVIDGLRFNGRELHVYCPTRGTAAPGTKTFDVLDAEGRFLETRTVLVPGCGPGDELFLLDDGRAICVKNLEAAMATAEAGRQVQVGDKRREAKEAEAGDDLEVILFAPAP